MRPLRELTIPANVIGLRVEESSIRGRHLRPSPGPPRTIKQAPKREYGRGPKDEERDPDAGVYGCGTEI